MAQRIDATYPTMVRWVMEYGWIEIGQDHMSRSFVRALLVKCAGRGYIEERFGVLCPVHILIVHIDS